MCSALLCTIDSAGRSDGLRRPTKAYIAVSAYGMAPAKKHIDVAEVTRLRKLKFKWRKVSKLVGVSERLMRKWRREVGFIEPLNSMTDNDIDTFINNNKQRGRGAVHMLGLFTAKGFNVTRKRVRESVNRVDAVGKELRKTKAIKRREYTVAGPHHMWHIDGHHKLAPYGLVTHGCIDGFSRMVLYLECTDNNRSTTTLKLFKQAVREHMVPARVRGDRGGENVLIADYMITARGLGRRSFIGGTSKYNTRIERLWRDVRDKAIEFYQSLFATMKLDGLDVDNQLHLFILQFMFKGRINEELSQFKDAWNNHTLSTEKNQTPLQMIESNLLTLPDNVIPVEGHDEVEEIPEGVQHVQVNPLLCPFTPGQLEYFRQQCAPLTLADSPDSLYDKYMCALEFAYRVLDMNV